MANAGSIARGVAYAGLGIGAGWFFDAYLSHVVQGGIPYFNDVASSAGHLLRGVGTVGGIVVGGYEAFFSPRARNNPPANVNPGNPNIPNAGPRITIINRGGRNNFRL